MGDGMYRTNKNLFYIMLVAIVLSFVSSWLGVLSIFVSIFCAACLALLFVHYKRALVVFLILIGAGTFVSYGALDEALFFVATVIAISLPISIGICKERPFNSFMLYSIIALLAIMIATLVYNTTVLSHLPLTLDNMLNSFLQPTFSMAEAMKQTAQVQNMEMDIDGLVRLMKNMSVGILIATAVIQVFLTYLFIVLLNRKAQIFQFHMMLPVFHFRINKLGAILFVLAALMSLVQEDSTLKLVALNYYVIMQMPFVLCGISMIHQLLSLYKVKKRTKRVVTAVLVFFAIFPLFNLAGSLSFIGALNCLLSVSVRRRE